MDHTATVTLSDATIKRLDINIGYVNNVVKVDVDSSSSDKQYMVMHVVNSLAKSDWWFAFDVNGDIYIRLTTVEDAEILYRHNKVVSFNSKSVRFHRVDEVLQLPLSEDVAV